MSFIIKKATKSDAAKMLEFLKRVGGETDNLTFGKEGVSTTIQEEAKYIEKQENSSDGVMLIAKENEEIVGTASLTRYPRRMSHRGDFSVSVIREHWNKGIGRELAEQIIAFAKTNNFEIIDLQVRSDNRAAIHLYEKLGFEKIGTHPFFFKIDGQNVPFDYMCLKIK